MSFRLTAQMSRRRLPSTLVPNSRSAPFQTFSGNKIRVTRISPGAVQTELAKTISSPDLKKRVEAFQAIAIPPLAIARAIAFAIEQPSDVDVNEIVVRPTAQSA